MRIGLCDEFARCIHSVFGEHLVQNATPAIFEIVSNAIFLDQPSDFFDLICSNHGRWWRLVIVHHEDLAGIPDTVYTEVLKRFELMPASGINFAPDVLRRFDRIFIGVRRQDFLRNSHAHNQRSYDSTA